jgi:hypothetical protein
MIIFLEFPPFACRAVGVFVSMETPQFLIDHLILSQPKRGQIVLTTLLIAPMDFQTFLQP